MPLRSARPPALAALLLAGLVVAGCGGITPRGGTTRSVAVNAPSPAATQAAAAPAVTRHRGLAPLPARVKQPGRRVRTPVPVLMYHVINRAPAGTPYPALWVPGGRFAAEVAALKAKGYTGVTLQRVWDAWHGTDTLPRRPVVLSFDDGYLSQYTAAAKTLRGVGWPGVLNLKVDNIGPGGLTNYEVKAMIAAGWELDAHTITHPDLTTVGAAQLAHEVSGSRVALQHRFGAPVSFFCYPAGRFDAAAEAAVRRAGYLAATTTQLGLAAPGTDPDAEPRVRVDADQTPAGLLREIAAATTTPEGSAGE